MRHEAVIDGTLVSWLPAGRRPPVLYVHGVPDSAVMWTPLLERTGGIAVDLPGFGESGKSAVVAVLARGLRRVPARLPRSPRRRSRAPRGPRLGGGRAHARAADRAAGGDRRAAHASPPPLALGRARCGARPSSASWRWGSPAASCCAGSAGSRRAHADEVLRYFDHGTQRAILKLYRSARENLVALDAITAPALVALGRARSLPRARVGGPDRGRAGRRDEGRDRPRGGPLAVA